MVPSHRTTHRIDPMMLPPFVYKLLLELALALGLVGAGVYLAHRHYAPTIAAQKAEIVGWQEAETARLAQEKVDQATLASLRQKNVDLARQNAHNRASLTAALASAPSWASQPVPKEVQDALSRP